MSTHHLRWSFDPATTMAELEDAHHELEDLYDRILSACESHAPASRIRHRIRSFLTYARWHFLEEENVMRAAGYAGYGDHKSDHQRLLQDAEDFAASLRDGPGSEDGPAIVSYFKYWLTGHMAGADRGLAEFLTAAKEDAGAGLPAGAPGDTPPANDS